MFEKEKKKKSCLKTLKADWHSQLGNAGKLIKIFKNHYKVFFGGVGGAPDGGGPIFKLIPLPLDFLTLRVKKSLYSHDLLGLLFTSSKGFIPRREMRTHIQ